MCFLCQSHFDGFGALRLRLDNNDNEAHDLMIMKSDAERGWDQVMRASDVTRGEARSDIDDELVIIQSERNCSTSQFLVSLSLKMLYYWSPCCAPHSNYLSENLERHKSKMFLSNK